MNNGGTLGKGKRGGVNDSEVGAKIYGAMTYGAETCNLGATVQKRKSFQKGSECVNLYKKG